MTVRKQIRRQLFGRSLLDHEQNWILHSKDKYGATAKLQVIAGGWKYVTLNGRSKLHAFHYLHHQWRSVNPSIERGGGTGTIRGENET